jgi:hypothetical protein
MASELIQLQDGTLVEVEVPGDQMQAVAGGMAAKVNATFEQVRPILVNACQPVIAAWQELSQEMSLKEAEIEVGLSFEGEGNIYVTKAKAGANLVVKLTLEPPAPLKPEE